LGEEGLVSEVAPARGRGIVGVGLRKVAGRQVHADAARLPAQIQIECAKYSDKIIS